MKKSKRILEDVTDYELVNTKITELSKKYFVHYVTVVNELKLRKLKNVHIKERTGINVTEEDVLTINIVDLAKRESVGTPALWKHINEHLGLTSKEVAQRKQALRHKERKLEHLSDDELRKSQKYLMKHHGTTQDAIKRERDARGIVVTTVSSKINQKVRNLSDEDLYVKSLSVLAKECGVSINTISIERRRRKSEKDS